MFLSEPLASLITFFRTSSIKFYYNSQQMSDSFYHILIWPCGSAMFWNFCVGVHRYSALTFDVIQSYLASVQDKKICNDYITLEIRVVM